MNTWQRILIATLAAVALPSLAQDPTAPAGAPATTPAPVYSGQTLTTRGTIESIDRETRTIVIKDEDGRMSSLRAGPDIANFDQLENGNKVTARYAQATLVSLGNTGEAPKPQVETQSSQHSSAQPKPALRGARHTRLMGEISEIDTKHNRLRLLTPKGESVLMAVPDTKKLTGLKEGDEVVATYIEAFALAVEPDDGSGAAESGVPALPR